MPKFDKDVFELMIEKVIIGEKEQDGNTNPRVITFILKSGNEIKCEDNKKSIVKENLTVGEDKNQQSSYEVSENYLQTGCEPCGVCGSVTTVKYKQYRNEYENNEIVSYVNLWIDENVSDNKNVTDYIIPEFEQIAYQYTENIDGNVILRKYRELRKKRNFD